MQRERCAARRPAQLHAAKMRLAGELRDPVRAEWFGTVGLEGWEAFGVAVDRGAGGVHDPADGGGLRCFEHPLGGGDVPEGVVVETVGP